MRTESIVLGGFVVAALTSLLLTPLVRWLARRNQWTDEPDQHRKIHAQHTPRVGGLAIVAAFLVGVGYFAAAKAWIDLPVNMPSNYVLAGGLVMAAVGFVDDLRGLHFSHKFAAQVAVAGIMIYGGFRVDHLVVPFLEDGFSLGLWLSIPLTLVWIVGVINAINLLDGMDGLAAGVSVIAFGSLAAAYANQGDLASLVLVVTIVGALTGFLSFNTNPATIFMGDTGSLFVGFVLATYSLRGTGHPNPLLAFLIPIIVLGLPVIDTGLAVLRRFIERRPLFHPDRDHIHHRIARRLGLSHRSTVMMLYLVSVCLGGVAFLIAMSDDAGATLILCVTAVATYLFLRWLGYLRVRDMTRMLRERRMQHPAERADRSSHRWPEGQASVEKRPADEYPGTSGDGSVSEAAL